MLQLLVGAGEQIVAALELWGTDEDAAVGGRRGPELELEDEVAWELLRRPELLDAAPFRRGRDDDPAIFGDVAAIGAALTAVEIELLAECWLVAVAPAGEVVAVEEQFGAGFGLEIVVGGRDEIERLEDRPDRGHPLGIAQLVGMEEIGELLRLRVAFAVGKKCPGVDETDARVPLHLLGDQGVELLDFLGRALLVGGAGEDLADDDRRPRVLGFDG